MSRHDDTPVLLARRVLSTLATVALASDQRDRQQAERLHREAVQHWDHWRQPFMQQRDSGDWCFAGAMGAASYLDWRAGVHKAP